MGDENRLLALLIKDIENDHKIARLWAKEPQKDIYFKKFKWVMNWFFVKKLFLQLLFIF